MEFQHKIAILALWSVLLCTAIVGEPDLNNFYPGIDGWAAVSDNEIDFCKKYGGSVEAGVNAGATSSIPIALSQLTMTIQADKERFEIEGVVDYLYQVSWYIEPVAGQQDFEIVLIGEGEDDLEIERDVAFPDAPGINFYAEYLTENFTHAKIVSGNDFLQVPIIYPDDRGAPLI